MKCPVCIDVDLTMTGRDGVEIDYCPKCRGVWLDRGELDKIIARSAQFERRDDDDDDDDDDRRDRYRDDPRRLPPLPHGGHGSHGQAGYYPPQKRKSFWSELFD